MSIRSLTVRSFNRQFRFLPRFPAPRHIPKLLESGRFQNARGNARAITASAINHRRLVAIELAHPFSEFRNENVARAGDVAFFPFTWPANIDNLERRFFLV